MALTLSFLKERKKNMTQIINKIALIFSGFVIGYIIGLNPTLSTPAADSETFAGTVTAYCPCEKCCQGSADGITASGHRIRPGDKLAAADKRFKFGRMISVPGYNQGRPVPILDRGGAIKGNKIDVLFPTHREALEWGVQTLQMKIEK
jgi:3D (Asp-Asp-Asp) domain-containing protein